MMTPEIVLAIVMYCQPSATTFVQNQDQCIIAVKKCVTETLLPTYADSLFFCIGRERKSK